MAKDKQLIKLDHISKSFGNQLVLDDLDLYIRENEFITLLGPSGCGKTTTLRILGGFETPDKGTVYFDGQDITHLPPNKRPLNTVFQKYALFTHMTIAENIAFGLKIKNKPKNYIQDKIKYALKLVNLDGFENRMPDSLSGGQQQRIAIARAIVNEPKVLLLDEPLGALDLKLRQDMQYELIRLKNELGITFLYVTHDQEEALTMSDKIVVMKDGNIEQIGTPTEIYNEPVNRYVANFIGQSNIMDGIMKKDYLVRFDDKNFECVDHDFKPNEPVDVVIRPEDIRIMKKSKGKMNGQVISVLFKGVHYEVIVETKRGVAKTVTLHVLGNEDVYNEEANEYMSAADFSMDIEDVDSITPQDLILRANAQAWKGDESEEEISISEVIYDIKAEAGKYPVVFKTANGTSVGADVNVVQPKVIEDEKEKIGIQAFDVYRTIDEIEESMAISVDLKNWADAYAWDLETENEVEIDDVRFDFDPMEIKEGTYEVTFVTEGRTYKIHTTEKQNEGDIVSLDFDPDDIHVMEKSVGL